MQEKSFSSQNEELSALHTKNLKSSISFMLCSLLLKFPKISIFWSRGHEHTAKIFKMLKNGKKDPDLSNFKKFQQEDNEKDLAEIVDGLLKRENNGELQNEN